MPLVSVLMPIYNTNTSHLKSAIESILCQSFTDFEFLIYNDGSTDTSLDGLINSFIDKRISYYSSKKNIGISQVRNLMVSLAKGKYLAVMDHDDIAVPNRFKLQVEFLEENPDVGICGGFQKRFGSILKRKIVKYPTSDEEIRVSLFFYCAILHPS